MLFFFFSVHNFNSMAALGLQINETYISRQFIFIYSPNEIFYSRETKKRNE